MNKFGWDLSFSFVMAAFLDTIVFTTDFSLEDFILTGKIAPLAGQRSWKMKIFLSRLSLDNERSSFSLYQAFRLLIIQFSRRYAAFLFLLLNNYALTAVASTLIKMVGVFGDNHYFAVYLFWVVWEIFWFREIDIWWIHLH